MTKDLLKTGMRVRMRSGEIYLVLKDVDTPAYGHQDIVFVRHGGFMSGIKYSDDLTRNSKSTFSKEFDIMEVYEIEEGVTFNTNILNLAERHSIWKRQEYSIEQREVFKALKVLGYNYVARQQSYYLYGYLNKPIKEIEYWRSHHISVQLPNDVSEILDFIKWEDKEPFEIPKV